MSPPILGSLKRAFSNPVTRAAPGCWRKPNTSLWPALSRLAKKKKSPQHAEALKAKKKMEEEEKKKKKAEKKKIAAGVWEKLYTRDGGKFWQHSVTGETSKTDPYY